MKHVTHRSLFVVFAAYFLVLSTGCSGQGPAGANWKRYSYAADNFTVEFPGEPQAKPNDSNTGTRYFTSMENDNFAYFVEKAELPADLNKTPDQIFEGYLGGAAKGTNSEVKSQKPISLNGHPGREFVLENDKMVLHFRLYLSGKTIYQVLVVASKSMASRAGTDRFFNSFALLK